MEYDYLDVIKKIMFTQIIITLIICFIEYKI